MDKRFLLGKKLVIVLSEVLFDEMRCFWVKFVWYVLPSLFFRKYRIFQAFLPNSSFHRNLMLISILVRSEEKSVKLAKKY